MEALLGGPEGYERKAMGMGYGQHPSWGLRQPGVGSSTGDFGRWLKRAPEVGRLSLIVKGTWREGSLAGDPSR
jgi:hypothetical protein